MGLIAKFACGALGSTSGIVRGCYTRLGVAQIGLVIAIGLTGVVQPVRADSGVACVQEQLTALGSDPGPIDGQFGRKTLSAFDALVASNPEQFGEVADTRLSAVSAAEWCSTLAERYTEISPIAAKYAGAIAEETGGFMYDIAENVPDASVLEIREGFGIARSYIEKTFGAEIPADIRRQMTVKIVATGKGNQEPGGGGGVATALAMGQKYPRPFFDVANEQWNQNSSGRGWTTKSDNMKTVVHEYVHGWQSVLGALTINRQVLGNWMNEGIAEYLAYKAMEDAGLMRWNNVLTHMRYAASGIQTERPLRDFGSTQTPAWPGHVGFLAIEWLVRDTPNGIMSLRDIAEQVQQGKDQRQAFAAAFGLELDSFYDQFDDWRQQFVRNPSRAIQNRPKLELAPAGSINVAEKSDKPQAKPLSPNAITWYEQALNLDGKGGDSDKEAASLYRLAAQAGHPEAARNLGGMLGEGRGVEKNEKEAAKWFRFAAENGDAQGQFGLAMWFLPRSERDERISWLRKAAAQGHQRAIAALEDEGVPLVDPEVGDTSGSTEPDENATQVASTLESENDPLAAEKCIQAGLNAAGYSAGAVDGVVGNGTKSAFEKFKGKVFPQLANYPFEDFTYKNWCLAITAKYPLSGAEKAYQDQLEEGAKVYVNIKVPRETSYFIVFRNGEKDLKVARSQAWTKIGNFGDGFQTVLDYSEVKSADNLCVVFEDGWVVLDRAGKGYPASCDARVPAMMISPNQLNQYNVEQR